MDMIKNEKGITLVTLAVTIIVLLILGGITFIIANNLILNKAILASNKTIEAMLEEQIGIAWLDTEASYWMEIKNNTNVVRQNYFETELKKNLENLEDVKEVTLNNENGTTIIRLNYKDREYKFIISKDGKVTCIHLLKENVKVGDYINYPIEYIDAYTQKNYMATNGWKVIDDGKMKGTSGQVRIISTGIPAKWYYDKQSKNVVDDLLNNFENLSFYDLDGNTIKGSSFRYEAMAEKVTTISLSDFNYAYNEIHKTNRKADDISTPNNKDGFFYIDKSYYWLATNSMESDEDIYFVSEQQIRYKSDLRNGIRPIICLKDDLTGVLESDVWKIIE